MSITPYTYDLEPGATAHESIGESNYIFVDFADRPIEIVINGEPVTLRKGSRYRSRGGMFSKFDIRNPDPVNPCRVVMLIGTDEVDNQIVEGEISIVPILRNADGTTKPDTRSTLEIVVAPERLAVTSYNQDDLIASLGAQLIPGTAIVNEAQSIFSGPGGFPVFAYTYNGFSNGAWRQYDWDLKLIQENTEQNLEGAVGVPYNGSMWDVGWSPGHGFMSCRKTKLYRNGPQSQRYPIYTAPFDIQTFCYLPFANSILLSSNSGEMIELRDDDLSVIRTRSGALTFSGAQVIRCDWTTNRIYYNYNRANWAEYFYDTDTIQTFTRDHTNVDLTAGVVVKGNEFISQVYLSNSGAKKVALYDFVTKPEFSAVVPGCELTAAMVKPAYAPQITANIEVQEILTGVVITGEVIKAALEFYFGRKVPDDYLDHIYHADLGKNQAGVPIKSISSGNDTFRAAGITDNFEVKVPGRFIFTIDNELELGAIL